MNKLLLTFAVLPLLIIGCGSGGDTATTGADQATSTSGEPSTKNTPTASEPKDQVVGTWKFDMANSKMPEMSDKDKADAAAFRVTLNSDGSYVTKSDDQENKGTWTVEDHTVTFKSESEGRRPPVMTLSDDGMKLTSTEGTGEEAMTIVMVKE